MIWYFDNFTYLQSSKYERQFRKSQPNRADLPKLPFVAKHTTKRSGGPFLVTFIRDIRHYTESALHHPHFQSYGFFP